jgi:hypothetical protein
MFFCPSSTPGEVAVHKQLRKFREALDRQLRDDDPARFQVRLDLHRIAPFLRFVLARHDCRVKPRSLAKAELSGELVA